MILSILIQKVLDLRLPKAELPAFCIVVLRRNSALRTPCFTNMSRQPDVTSEQLHPYSKHRTYALAGVIWGNFICSINMPFLAKACQLHVQDHYFGSCGGTHTGDPKIKIYYRFWEADKTFFDYSTMIIALRT